MSPEAPQAGYPKWDYQEYPKSLARDDFWGQVRRTVMGERISEAQVGALVEHVGRLLRLRPGDILLDLGCGNGALTARLFDFCSGYAGVDASAYLIGIAHEFFERPPTHLFFEDDVTSFVHGVGEPERFTKGLCYALLQYLSVSTVEQLLETLFARFSNLERLVIGNLPNRDRAGSFFKDGGSQDLDEPQSQIGRWWSKAEFEALASGIGWKVELSQMEPHLFNATYRFDATLTR
ncbi:MAG TPA: methyltransferase domain-containing protein [Acidimicrobiales bacterium]|nr:methyltransferase domain-containing protein [Acidimicrobiales bacterium]